MDEEKRAKVPAGMIARGGLCSALDKYAVTVQPIWMGSAKSARLTLYWSSMRFDWASNGRRPSYHLHSHQRYIKPLSCHLLTFSFAPKTTSLIFWVCDEMWHCCVVLLRLCSTYVPEDSQLIYKTIMPYCVTLFLLHVTDYQKVNWSSLIINRDCPCQRNDSVSHLFICFKWPVFVFCVTLI